MKRSLVLVAAVLLAASAAAEERRAAPVRGQAPLVGTWRAKVLFLDTPAFVGSPAADVIAEHDIPQADEATAELTASTWCSLGVKLPRPEEEDPNGSRRIPLHRVLRCETYIAW
jgi:hypothetical protein